MPWVGYNRILEIGFTRVTRPVPKLTVTMTLNSAFDQREDDPNRRLISPTDFHPKEFEIYRRSTAIVA